MTRDVETVHSSALALIRVEDKMNRFESLGSPACQQCSAPGDECMIAALQNPDKLDQVMGQPKDRH